MGLLGFDCHRSLGCKGAEILLSGGMKRIGEECERGRVKIRMLEAAVDQFERSPVVETVESLPADRLAMVDQLGRGGKQGNAVWSEVEPPGEQ